MRILWLFIVLLVSFMRVAAQEAPDPAQVRPAVPIERVVVMSLDGMRPDALLEVGAEHLLALAERGAVDWDAKTVLPSVTVPGHTSMLTGLDVSDHGVRDNHILNPCLPVGSPTFLTTAAQAGYRTAMVVGKVTLCRLHQTELVDYTFALAGDRSVVDRVIELLEADYEIIFAHFPNPDYFGHLTGWRSAEYDYNVFSTDAQIGRVLETIDALGRTDETLVIVTADHGGENMGHGTDSHEDRTIPWIVAGPGVRPGTTLEGVSVADTAATVLWALGLPLPDNALGQPRLDAFELVSTPEALSRMASGEGLD